MNQHLAQIPTDTIDITLQHEIRQPSHNYPSNPILEDASTIGVIIGLTISLGYIISMGIRARYQGKVELQLGDFHLSMEGTPQKNSLNTATSASKHLASQVESSHPKK